MQVSDTCYQVALDGTPSVCFPKREYAEEEAAARTRSEAEVREVPREECSIPHHGDA